MASNREFARLCGNSNVVAFAEKAITQSYCDKIPHHADELRVMMKSIFPRLVACHHSGTDFAAALRYVRTQILKTDEADFWFTDEYRRYKRDVKPSMRLGQIEPWLTGGRVLDFGAGDGALASMLDRRGYQVTLTDVLDYRNTDAQALPYFPMVEPGILPFADQSFDTALVLLTLHHVDLEDLSSILSGLRRVARCVVVEEECYALPSNIDGLSAVLARDVLLREFVAMAPSDQLDYLKFLDYFGNVVVGGLQKIDLPFQFKTIDDWRAVFAKQGFIVAQVLLLGFQTAYFHRSSHVWFVLDT